VCLLETGFPGQTAAGPFSPVNAGADEGAQVVLQVLKCHGEDIF
jgi:hypothetical protein